MKYYNTEILVSKNKVKLCHNGNKITAFFYCNLIVFNA